MNECIDDVDNLTALLLYWRYSFLEYQLFVIGTCIAGGSPIFYESSFFSDTRVVDALLIIEMKTVPNITNNELTSNFYINRLLLQTI